MQSSTYGTLFNFSRTKDSPLVDLAVNKGRIPSHPQPVPIGPSSFRSWFQSNRTMSGQQIDELCRYRLWSCRSITHTHRSVGGPHRPEPVMRTRDMLPQKDFEDSMASPSTSFTAVVQPNLYSQLVTTMDERRCSMRFFVIESLSWLIRRQMLGGLEESFKSMEQGSKDMLSQVIRFLNCTTTTWFCFAGKETGCTKLDKILVWILRNRAFTSKRTHYIIQFLWTSNSVKFAVIFFRSSFNMPKNSSSLDADSIPQCGSWLF